MHDVFRSISSIFKDIHADDQAREAVMFAAWKRAAGEQLMQHAVPVRFVGKRLTIAVSGIRWKQQMEQLGPQMVFRLNGAFGAPVLNFIQFVVDENAVAKYTAWRQVQSAAVQACTIPRNILDAAAAIRDPGLRADFLDAAGSCLHRVEP